MRIWLDSDWIYIVPLHLPRKYYVTESEGVKFHLYHIGYSDTLNFYFSDKKVKNQHSSFDRLFLKKYYQTWFQVKNTDNKNLVYTKIIITTE